MPVLRAQYRQKPAAFRHFIHPQRPSHNKTGKLRTSLLTGAFLCLCSTAASHRVSESRSWCNANIHLLCQRGQADESRSHSGRHRGNIISCTNWNGCMQSHWLSYRVLKPLVYSSWEVAHTMPRVFHFKVFNTSAGLTSYEEPVITLPARFWIFCNLSFSCLLHVSHRGEQ